MSRPECLKDAASIAETLLADIRANNGGELPEEACEAEIYKLIGALGLLADAAYPYAKGRAIYVREMKKHIARIAKPRALKNR